MEPDVPELPDEQTAHKKRVWKYHMGELMKIERVIEGNRCN